MVTLESILHLPVFRGARVVAGRKGLRMPVRWCHVAEVLDIARLLQGGELLLTTGLALNVPPERQIAYVEELKTSGVAALMLELGRQFDAAPPAMVEAAERIGLPLITLPFDTPFVKVTQAVHARLLARETDPDGPAQGSLPEQRILADLWAGRIPDISDLRQRLYEGGWTLPAPAAMAVLVVTPEAEQAAVRSAAAAELGARTWLFELTGSEGRLVAFAAEPAVLDRKLTALARRFTPLAAGVGRSGPDPGSLVRSLAEAGQTMRLRRTRSDLSPLFMETGTYRLALMRTSDEIRQFVAEWIGPLIEYDRLHRTNLAESLRLLLDHGPVVAEAARRLHMSRQGLYHRRQRIADVLGRDLDDPEVRAALMVALRFGDVLSPERP